MELPSTSTSGSSGINTVGRSTIVKEVVNASIESDSEIFDVILEHSDSEDDELFLEVLKTSLKRKRVSIKNYLEEVVPTYSEVEFRRHSIILNFRANKVSKSIDVDVFTRKVVLSIPVLFTFFLQKRA